MRSEAGGCRRKLRWLFVTNIPSPYQIDFFTALHEVAGDVFHVIFTATRESDRQFSVPKSLSFSHVVLNPSMYKLRRDWHANVGLSKLLDQFAPSVVVLGGSYLMPDARTVRRFCVERRLAWVYWGENPSKRRGAIRGMLRRLYLRWFLSGAIGAIGIGSAAQRSYAHLMSGRPVENIPYAPNLTSLLSPDEALRRASAELRRALSVADRDVMILFSGVLSRRKAPDVLLEAFSALPDLPSMTHLVFVGDGPLRDELQSRCRSLEIDQRVHFLGFKSGAALQECYLAANIFVLPTRTHEGWGVVVQEAMAAGNAVICSNIAGAAVDLVVVGSTGYVVEPDSPRALVELLGNLVRDESLRTRIGEGGRRLVANTSATPAARRFMQMIQSIERAEGER